MRLTTGTRRRVALGVVMTATATGVLAAAPVTAATAAEGHQIAAAGNGGDRLGGGGITWRHCPRGESATATAPAIAAADAAPGQRQAALERLECATITVPLDYTDPDGATMSIAVSRLRAGVPARRRGVLLLNWGGPGWSGTGLPVYLATSRAGTLAEEFDLIGFDPRGTGDSGGASCPQPTTAATEPVAPASSSKERARLAAQQFAAAVAACADADPVRTRQLTIQNVASDMDRIRAALGERRLSYLGVSWGTRLGAAYRTMFPDHVDRMLLDSVMTPESTVSTADLIPLMESSFQRLSAWLAANDDRYQLGAEPDAVRSTLLGLRDRLDETPFEVDGGRIDGENVAVAAVAFRSTWPAVGRLLAAIRSGKRAEGTAAATDFLATVAWPSSIVPERYNQQANLLLWCNEATEAGDFESYWDTHVRQAAQYPMAGQLSPTHGDCAGWPFAPNPILLRRQPGSLQLVAHTYEWNTPPTWAVQMQRTVGGALAYVDDDVHGSLVQTPCADQAVRFLRTGRTFTGHCAGIGVPA